MHHNSQDELTVVCFKWRPKHDVPEHKRFKAEHVNALHKMVGSNLKRPHRFVCITDDSQGLNGEIGVVDLNTDLIPLQGQYPKLFLFSPNAESVIGPRILYLDLDVVITGELDSLLDNLEEMKIYKKTFQPGLWKRLRSSTVRKRRAFYASGEKYNSSMLYLKAGSRAVVWDRFSPQKAESLKAKYSLIGTDQIWIYHILGGSEAAWTTGDGVYDYGSNLPSVAVLPENARIVIFAGSENPWEREVQERSPWITRYYPSLGNAAVSEADR